VSHPRYLYDLENCGLARALAVLGEKWTLLILREAFYGLHRFDDFSRALGLGRGVLSLRLKELIQSGVLEQRLYVEDGQRPRQDYHLTAKGRDLYPVLLGLSQWSERWSPSPDGPVALVTDRSTGSPVRAIMTSTPTEIGLSLSDISIRPGPGAKLLAGDDTEARPAAKPRRGATTRKRATTHGRARSGRSRARSPQH
jgi:DNA-binding HxlR family transcriptional regulator